MDIDMNIRALVGSGDRIGLVTLPFLVVGVVLNITFPSLFTIGGPPTWLGVLSLLILLVGVVNWAWCVYLLLSKVPRRELITNGPYALVKHPLYTGRAGRADRHPRRPRPPRPGARLEDEAGRALQLHGPVDPGAARGAIRAELELNRRTAPELYRRVLPVTRADGGRLALGGAGEPVEWLLEMRRFPAEAQLDRVAARGELTGSRRPARPGGRRFPRRGRAPAEAGGAAGMREVVDGNAGDLASLAPGAFERDAVAALNRATAAELDRRAGLLDRRREAGEVRRCHGDLHLANIVLLDGRPVLFDCLEFSEELASIDVLYDLAFLVMDLLERGLRAEAWRLLQAYNDRRVEDEGLALLPLFLSVRAAVRRRSPASRPSAPSTRATAGAAARARAYLGLARAAFEPSPAMLVAIGGRSGTGKSTPRGGRGAPGRGDARRGGPAQRRRAQAAARARADRAPAPRGVRPRDDGEGLPRLPRARAAAAGRAPVVCDAVHGRERERRPSSASRRSSASAFRGFWLEAPEAVLEARVAARAGDASDADVAATARVHSCGRPGTPVSAGRGRQPQALGPDCLLAAGECLLVARRTEITTPDLGPRIEAATVGGRGEVESPASAVAALAIPAKGALMSLPRNAYDASRTLALHRPRGPETEKLLRRAPLAAPEGWAPTPTKKNKGPARRKCERAGHARRAILIRRGVRQS